MWNLYYLKGILAVRDSIDVLQRLGNSHQREWQYVIPYTFESLEQDEAELIVEGSKALGLGSAFYVAAVGESIKESMLGGGPYLSNSKLRLLKLKSSGRGTKTRSRGWDSPQGTEDHLVAGQ